MPQRGRGKDYVHSTLPITITPLVGFHWQVVVVALNGSLYLLTRFISSAKYDSLEESTVAKILVHFIFNCNVPLSSILVILILLLTSMTVTC